MECKASVIIPCKQKEEAFQTLSDDLGVLLEEKNPISILKLQQLFNLIFQSSFRQEIIF